MCNTEFVVMSSILAMSQKEKAKEAERKAAKAAAYLSLSAEGVRRTQEDEKLNTWLDTEARKVNVALGATKVTAGAAGVDIPALTAQWQQASVELAGAARATKRRQAAAGDLREVESESIKQQRLDRAAPSGAAEWGLNIMNAFAQGIYMERKIWGKEWDANVFGTKLPEWMYKFGDVDVDYNTRDPEDPASPWGWTPS